MDSVTVIMAVFFLAICLMPFVLAATGSKKREKQLLRSLAEIAKQHNCSLSQQDSCKDMAIGLCENGNALIFFRQGKNKTTSEYIDLSEVKSCKLIHLSKTVSAKEGPHKITEALGLSFSFTSKNKAELVLDFFKVDENFQLSGELKLAEKWLQIIKLQKMR